MNELRAGLAEDIINRAEIVFEPLARGSYELSYPFFIQYFEDRPILTRQDFIIGANFTYAWMPTIFNFKNLDIENATRLSNNVKNGVILCEADLLLLKSVINNSLVGTSKLLHFINPNNYAIWDSRVLKFLSGKGYKHTLEKPNLYKLYLDLCKQVTQHSDFESLLDRYNELVGYQVSPLRLAELIMFHGYAHAQPLGKNWLV